MKLYTVFLTGIALGIVGCAEKEQAAPEAAAEVEPAAPVETEAPIEADTPDETMAVVQDWRTPELLDHMHVHAVHLDDINYALDDDDLDGARSAAAWIAQHNMVDDLPTELEPFVDAMREAAATVEAAPDLDTARAAADQIGAQCRACHDAEGILAE